MSNLTNYYQLGKKLSLYYPELARMLVQKETEIKDWEAQLPEIYNRFKSYRDIRNTPHLQRGSLFSVYNSNATTGNFTGMILK